MAFFKKGVVLPQSLKKERKLAEIIEFDQKNVPEWHPSGLELSEDETVEMLAGMDKDNAADRETGENRSAPHDRTVVIKDKDDKRSFHEISKMEKDKLRLENEKEPKVALVGRDNYVRGIIPLSRYMDESGIDRMLQMLDSGQVSITHSAFPEAIYCRVEDGMEKGRVAWAGTINGEAEYSVNRNMDLTVSNFSKSDNIHVHETALPGEMEAREDELEEELADRAASHSAQPYYTGDYRGWDDPDYEPDEELEREYLG